MIDILTLIREHVALSGTILILVAFILRSIYRLYFDPLHHIPGPKLAAISHLYEFYYDVIREGMFVWEIERMHQRYGKVNLLCVGSIGLFTRRARPLCS